MSVIEKEAEAAENSMVPAEKGYDVPNESHELDTAGFISPEEERAVVRKIDLVILPFLCFVFLLQYLDKQSLSYAAVSIGIPEIAWIALTFPGIWSYRRLEFDL